MKSPIITMHCLHLFLVIVLTIVITVAQGGLASDVSGATVADKVSSSIEQKSAPAKVEAKPVAEAKPLVAVSASSKQEGDEESQARKGRSEPPPPPPQASNGDQKKSDASSSESATPKPTEKPASATSSGKQAADQQKTKHSGSSSSASSSRSSSLSGKSSSNKKQQSNLGTVTSTGSGGPAHYMSKHDAYSAIAEKHGALAQDAMRKSDKRNHLQRFSGIQKASGGLGDMLSPFKGVTDSGLARNIGASVRSIMKGKYSVPAYLASAVLGAVALMAFYESPMSPLPVPSLPEPPIGRFPPEMPSLPPGTQVPFRGSQQLQQQQLAQQQQYQGYGYGSNQRSFQVPNSQQQQQPSQQPSSVLFPGNTPNAQQRQSVSSPSGSVTGPVQLAANLLSSVGGKQQNAQRKSGSDLPDTTSSRSFFGNSANGQSGSFMLPFNTGKLSAPINSNNNGNNQHKQSSTSSSLLSFFGLGGGNHQNGGNQVTGSNDALQAAASNSGIGYYNSGSSLLSSLEPKGQAASGVLSNSHVVNKVKSYFNIRPAGGSSPSSSLSPSNSFSSSSTSNSASNPYDEYQRMSFVQALMKDTAFLPSFLIPSRKSSSSPSSSVNGAPAGQSGVSPSAPLSAPPAAARMQVDNMPLINTLSQQPQLSQASNVKRTSSGFGLGRIAHALLDTFTSGVMQRSSSVASDTKQYTPSIESQSPLVSATSLLTDIMSSYNSQQAAAQQQQQQQQHKQNANNLYQEQPQQQHVDSSNKQQQQQIYNNVPEQQQQHQQQAASSASQSQQQPTDLATGRALDNAPVVNVDESNDQQSQSKQISGGKQTVSSNPSAPSASTASDPTNQGAVHSRKTRSVGLEYPIESNQALARRDQQQAQLQPSRAAQINNLVDFVADSYSQNRLLFNFVMNQVGLSHAVPYVEQILVPGKENSA